MSEIKNGPDFLRGQEDCKKGVPHKDGGADYNRGYAAQYELEQVLSAKGFN